MTESIKIQMFVLADINRDTFIVHTRNKRYHNKHSKQHQHNIMKKINLKSRFASTFLTRKLVKQQSLGLHGYL